MQRFKIGVIGCGRISATYREAFSNMQEQVQVAFAVDKVPERAEQFAAAFEGCGHSSRIEDLLEQPLDAVHILTPHFLHKEHAVQCLEAGFHVLTEKPVATTLEDADCMISAAAQAGRQLGVIFQNRYIRGIRAVKALIGEGKLGKLLGAWSSLNWWRPPSYYACDWKGSWEKEGGGVVIDQAIHSLDLVRYLMGCEVASVKAHIDRRVLTEIEVEDVADAAITFENGAVYSFFACNYNTGNDPIRVQIRGEKGWALLEGSEVTLSLNGEPIQRIAPDPAPAGQGEDYWGACHLMQLRDFYDCLADGRKVPFDPADAKKTLALVLDIYREGKKPGAFQKQD